MSASLAEIAAMDPIVYGFMPSPHYQSRARLGECTCPKCRPPAPTPNTEDRSSSSEKT